MKALLITFHLNGHAHHRISSADWKVVILYVTVKVPLIKFQLNVHTWPSLELKGLKVKCKQTSSSSMKSQSRIESMNNFSAFSSSCRLFFMKSFTRLRIAPLAAENHRRENVWKLLKLGLISCYKQSKRPQFACQGTLHHTEA